MVAEADGTVSYECCKIVKSCYFLYPIDPYEECESIPYVRPRNEQGETPDIPPNQIPRFPNYTPSGTNPPEAPDEECGILEFWNGETCVPRIVPLFPELFGDDGSVPPPV